MWTTKEVVIISLATGLAFLFATIYSQRKIQQYIDNKVTEKSTNPLSSLLTKDMVSTVQSVSLGAPEEHRQEVEQLGRSTPPPKKQEFHEPPPGAGERWTPLPI